MVKLTNVWIIYGRRIKFNSIIKLMFLTAWNENVAAWLLASKVRTQNKQDWLVNWRPVGRDQVGPVSDTPKPSEMTLN